MSAIKEDIPEVGDDNIDVTIDGEKLLPVVYSVEAAGSSKMTEYTDQCGYTESENLGAGTMTLTIKAILYKEQVQTFYATYETGQAVDVTHPAEIGTFELNIQDITIKMEGEHTEWVGDDGRVRKVFNTQIQLKSPEAETQ